MTGHGKRFHLVGYPRSQITEVQFKFELHVVDHAASLI